MPLGSSNLTLIGSRRGRTCHALFLHYTASRECGLAMLALSLKIYLGREKAAMSWKAKVRDSEKEKKERPKIYQTAGH